MLNCVVPSRLKKTPLTYSVIACNVATAMGKNFSWFSVFTTFKRESVSKSTLNGDNLYQNYSYSARSVGFVPRCAGSDSSNTF